MTDPVKPPPREFGLDPPTPEELWEPILRRGMAPPVIPEGRATWLALVPDRFKTKDTK